MFFSLAAATAFLFLVALGPGLYGGKSFWMYDFYSHLCHQDPHRSFTLNGIQMAVCARCLGIYSFLFLGWISMPVFTLLKFNKRKWLIGFLIVAIGLNLADILGNNFDFWTNTHYSRFVLGSLFGLSIATLLTTDFFKLNKIGTYG